MRGRSGGLLQALRHPSHRGRRLGAGTAVAFAAVALASSAPALPRPARASILYSVPPGEGYTVSKQNGLTTVTFDQCLPAGEAVGVTVLTEVKGGNIPGAEATWVAERADGGTVSFVPPSLSVSSARESETLVVIVPSLSAVGPAGASFRIKLIPGPGSGVGQSSGVAIDAPCVLQPPPTPPDGTHPCPSAAQHRAGVRVPGRSVAVRAPRVNDDCVLRPEHPIVIPPPGGSGGGGGTPAHPIVPPGSGGGSGSGSGGSGSGGPALPDAPALGGFGPLFGGLLDRQPKCVSWKAVNAVDPALSVRAGDPARVTVTVHAGDVTLRYARVRITGLAVNQTKFTGAHGVTFTVVPIRSGHMFIRADACLGTDDVAVLPAENLCQSVARPADGSTADRPRRGPPARMAC